DTGVRDRHAKVVVHLDEADGDVTARVGELHGVGQQVPEDLQQPVLVAAHQREAGRQIGGDLDAPGFRRGTDDVHGGGDGGREVHVNQLEPYFAGRDTRHVEHVRHER